MVIEVRNLSYAYPDATHALRSVDLRVDAGERVALLGPNGAGKTTLALHLNGVLSASSGQVVIDGTVLTRETVRDIRRRVGMVFQDPDDQLFMPTVAQDVAFGPWNYQLPDIERRVAAALAAVGMQDVADRAPHHLSFGQRRRVAIATVLGMDPRILVLDEPSSNLDPASRRELADVLAGLDVTMLMVTHDLLLARQLCPRAVVLADGQVRYDGPTEALLRNEGLLAGFRLELPYGVHLADLDG